MAEVLTLTLALALTLPLALALALALTLSLTLTRSADLLLDPSSARVARVLRSEEGVRPVTGARRLTVVRVS